jgi:hypothetical protein
MKTSHLSSLIAATCFALTGCVSDAGVGSRTAVGADEPTGFDTDRDTTREAGELADLSGLANDFAAPEHHVPGSHPDAGQFEPGVPGGQEPGAPNDPNMPNWSLSVLAQGPGGDQILLFDADGGELGAIDTGTYNAQDFAWHEGEAFWLVSDSNTMHRVEGLGNMGTFTSTLISWGWRMNITDPGDVVIADEYEMQSFTSDGTHQQTSPYDSGDCYMDIAIVGGDSILSLNVYGNSLDSWDFATNTVTPEITNVPYSVDYIGTDDSGMAWMGGAWDDLLYRQDGTTTTSVGALGTLLGIEVYGVKALEPASEDSVYVLYAGTQDGIAEVSADGFSTVVATADSVVWTDLASR